MAGGTVGGTAGGAADGADVGELGKTVQVSTDPGAGLAAGVGEAGAWVVPTGAGVITGCPAARAACTGEADAARASAIPVAAPKIRWLSNVIP